ncbi:MAG: polysaccharide deacetylase [Gammaproteobacteria bacterium]|nr:polysaccharide deacetylase [Gammaproteobacteria bacterium]MCP5200870.1 polysaccharide deacetylase [Gammaproteobacteria bacterium]
MAEHRLSCCITFDFDGMSSWIGTLKTRNPSMVSRGQFGAVAVPRLLDLLAARGIEASFAVPGHTAYAYPHLVERIAAAGHELVHHGWVHENPASFDPDGELRVLERGLEALERVAGVRPRGYRSPAWDLSERSVELLVEHGFHYDSSCMGHDFRPYYLRSGDTWTVDDPFRFGVTTSLVEMPVTWMLDDFPPAEFVLGMNTGLQAPSLIEENWRADFDYAWRDQPGGVYILTLHPQTIARGRYFLMLERLLDYFAGHDGVVFESMGRYVERWRAANPLEAWKAANPDLTGEHAIE